MGRNNPVLDAGSRIDLSGTMAADAITFWALLSNKNKYIFSLISFFLVISLRPLIVEGILFNDAAKLPSRSVSKLICITISFRIFMIIPMTFSFALLICASTSLICELFGVMLKDIFTFLCIKALNSLKALESPGLACSVINAGERVVKSLLPLVN